MRNIVSYITTIDHHLNKSWCSY